MYTVEETFDICATIFAQMGGAEFAKAANLKEGGSVIGTRPFDGWSCELPYITFKLNEPANNDVAEIRVTYRPVPDDYVVDFKNSADRVVKTVEIYCDMFGDVISDYTGIDMPVMGDNFGPPVVVGFDA